MFKKWKEKLKHEEDSPSQELSSQQLQSQLHPSNPYYVPPQTVKDGYLDVYKPPPGPPPSHGNSSETYFPPPGPPPSHAAVPPSWEPPPYHDWTVVPDNSLLPPPPSIGYEDSPNANASGEESTYALAWTKANPLWQPQNLTPDQHGAVQHGRLALLKPPSYAGNLEAQKHPGHWKCKTRGHCRDATVLTSLPAYSVLWDSPLRTQQPKTIYFELKIKQMKDDSGIAIGFAAPPYPTFRLPGWNRGSLGLHGDDGRKYVNDTYGGVDFTGPFKVGEVVGIGMTFAPPQQPPSYEQTQQGRLLDIDVFFTRNGVQPGGTERGWDGNEELDAERSPEGTMGLRGDHDLFPAIGVFGKVEFEVFFNPKQWLHNPH